MHSHMKKKDGTYHEAMGAMNEALGMSWTDEQGEAVVQNIERKIRRGRKKTMKSLLEFSTDLVKRETRNQKRKRKS